MDPRNVLKILKKTQKNTNSQIQIRPQQIILLTVI